MRSDQEQERFMRLWTESQQAVVNYINSEEMTHARHPLAIVGRTAIKSHNYRGLMNRMKQLLAIGLLLEFAPRTIADAPAGAAADAPYLVTVEDRPVAAPMSASSRRE